MMMAQHSHSYSSCSRRIVCGSYRRYVRSKSNTTALVARTASPTNTPGRAMAVLLSPPFLAAGILHWSSTAQRSHSSTSSATRNDGSKRDKKNKDAAAAADDDDGGGKDSSTRQAPFDATKHWNNAKEYLEQKVLTNRDAPTKDKDKTVHLSQEADDGAGSSKEGEDGGWLGFLKGLRPGGGDDQKNDGAKETQETKRNLDDVQSSLMGILMGRSPNQGTVEDLISKARSSSEQGDVSDSVSLNELMTILRTAGDEFDQLLKKHLHGKNLPTILPTNLYYYLEHEDEVKNFSWRRRKHRFCRGINIEYVNELNSYMRIAEIGYIDNMETIKRELSDTFGYEVIFCQMDSLPGQPSHFLAVKKDQSSWSSSLDMLLCVRGTKTITDVITDLLADAVAYRGGKAHSGISKSGTYLAEKHLDTFQEFLKASGKKKINLTLVGHSLGAGAASIAGIELQARDDFDVQVIGFGCPALLSKELSESTQDYITTVVADNDCIPRMSLANMMNTMLDIGEYDWIPKAKQDLEDVVAQVQVALPAIVSDSSKKNLMDILTTKVLSTIDIPPSTDDRMEPVLFPPGKCIHFYRDGYGLSGAVVPCTFFDSIDVHRRMVDDHLFDTGYRLTFLDLMRQYTKDHYFQFDIKK